MTLTLPESVNQVTVQTGNILSLNGIIAKPTQSATEELIESIKLTLEDVKSGSDDSTFVLLRKNDDLSSKMAQANREELKIGAKLFVNHKNCEAIHKAVLNIFSTLKTNQLDNLILAYSDASEKSKTGSLDSHLQNIWQILETYVQPGGEYHIAQLGIADLDEAGFRALYDWATVKPSIMQINLATCCVVPPTLQEFCGQNNVQLLTHSDPIEILPNNELQNLFPSEKNLGVFWVVRFQVHIKCRGVLSSKGYIVSLNRSNIGDI